MSPAAFPHLRMRRTRASAWSRALVAETSLAPSDLIWPLFIAEGDAEEPIASLPGVSRWPVGRIAERAREARDLGIRLEWTPNAESDRVDEYRIYYAPEEAGPYNQIGVSGRAEFEFLSLTTAGWYRVTAANTAGESPPSPAVQFKP